MERSCILNDQSFIELTVNDKSLHEGGYARSKTKKLVPWFTKA